MGNSRADVSNANGLFDTINTRYYVRRGMRYAAEIYIVQEIQLSSSGGFPPPSTPYSIISINKYQSIDSLAKHWLDSSAMCTKGGGNLPGAQVVMLGLL